MTRRIISIMVVGVLGCGGGSSPGGNGPGAGSNHPPTVAASAGGSSVVMGQSLGLSARATDPDGDALTYSWTQGAPASPLGTFSSTASASPTWTAPTIGALTAFDLTVTVSDGHGGSTSGTVHVYAKTSSELSFIADVEPIFLKACTAGCHSGAQPPAGLSLEADKAYAQIVNVPSKLACTSPTEMRVQPGDPDDSALFRSILRDTCVPRMPLGIPTYFDQAPAEVDTIRTWIQNGAPNN